MLPEGTAVARARQVMYAARQMTSDTPALLTKRETAEFLRISIRTLDRMREEGQLRAYWLRGTLRFKREEVEGALRLAW